MKVQDLHFDYSIVEDILKAFLVNEIHKFGFSSLVLGLSGGIDSAVVCELAVRALGADNVLALMMPYATSSPESIEHAELSNIVHRLLRLHCREDVAQHAADGHQQYEGTDK